MGIYLLAAIVFILFIIFIADLIRDSKDRPFNPNFRLNQYREEFGEEEDFMDLDYDEEYADDYFDFDESEVESMNLTTRVDDELEMNYNEEFAEEPEIRPERRNQHIVESDDDFYRR
jgi:hypothetical protein